MSKWPTTTDIEFIRPARLNACSTMYERNGNVLRKENLYWICCSTIYIRGHPCNTLRRIEVALVLAVKGSFVIRYVVEVLKSRLRTS